MGDYGIVCSGAATVSVYPTLISSQVEYILNNSSSTAVIVEDQVQLSKINKIWENCPQLGHVIVMDESDESEDARIINFSDFLMLGSKFEKESGKTFEDLTTCPPEHVAIVSAPVKSVAVKRTLL